MSAAIAEKAEVLEEVREIRDDMDRAMFLAFGGVLRYAVDLKDPKLKEEYFLYRDTFHGKGPLDSATLHRLVVEQMKRKAKTK